ncbi:MAG: NAD(+)/NADH kinase [Gemmatimonadetes bacterium]|uniref:NAD kinase n=1 Tax=Candidatus Kutchimonas denitrificans TaxID=3056748 RepID=A0AAE4Z5I3_9BACT|nr:NAD(+)/NADH kinase [Gemmatimonadota bacterium]NIR74180.1 NAD(+)/NADH kinase [Candidatus Kutchimonas denitrificans]NIR99802.1 NAD(+)/NADH kinase [Gemmatimonadota bacterium]NIT65391.1 NAD(+)/NADH kinase [Gemmatimonadota bacterium]NIU51757.1 NAD(+) kinase [Gemmatimonadota bacterium]
MSGIKHIGVMGNPAYPNVTGALQRLAEIAPEHGFDLLAAELIRADRALGLPALPDDAHEIDMLITLGGDGALLGGARWAGPAGTPVLGVNLGRLGFLTAVTMEEMDDALARIADGDYEIDTRMALEVTSAHTGEDVKPYYALNDAVLHRGGLVRVVALRVWADDEEVGLYRGDGVIVATPTGSTAYSLSSGGPILDPRLDAIVITPISPHTMAVRPLVLRATARITIEVVASPEELMLTIDGQVGSPLEPGDRVTVNKADRPVQLIRMPGDSFHSLLRRKLKWGDVSEPTQDDA